VTITLTAPPVRRPTIRRTLGVAVLPGALATALALLTIVMRWRGSDLPAHFFRVSLVERDGFQIWNNQWFGGHHTLGYGALFPVLGAAFGIWTVAVLSAAVSATLADVLIKRALGRRCLPASLWFAAGTMTNVAVGRLPFALGMAVGLGALIAAQSRRPVPTVLLTVATAAASPVVSAFLAIVYVSWALVSSGRARRDLVLLGVAALAPVLVIAVLYPQGGSFPFRWQALVLTIAECVVTGLLVPREQRLVRATAGVYALAAVAAFVLPTPLGANLTRFGVFAAGPVLLATVPMRRALLAILLPAILFWQWSPALDAILRAGHDGSVEQAYYAPLLRYLESVDAERGRTEVVPTGRHWEAAFVAARYPIARGWERQLDIRFNRLFYEPDLTVAAYHQWLLDSGIDRVVLPDAPLDDSGKQEAALVEDGLAFLHPVWSNEHWRVWDVVDSPGLVDGATVVDIGADSMFLRVATRGDVTVRVRSSAFWATDPPVCVEATTDGWVVLRNAPVGDVELFLDESRLLTSDDKQCDGL
jgi:hypothetical protein